MMRYLVHPRGRIPASDKYSQKRLDHTKQSATDTLKTTSKRVI